jgi:hypothetical protein
MRILILPDRGKIKEGEGDVIKSYPQCGNKYKDEKKLFP